MAYGDSGSGDLSNKSVTFKGFSSRADKQNFKLYDFEVAKQDLINRLSVRKGERVENPEFGTMIYDAIFEPFTDDLKDARKWGASFFSAYEVHSNGLDSGLPFEFPDGIDPGNDWTLHLTFEVYEPVIVELAYLIY